MNDLTQKLRGIANVTWQLTTILFFIIGSPFFVAGLIAGFCWDMLCVGFYWGKRFIDIGIDNGAA